ncbi:phosphate signaling complex protein PhoU [Parasphingopyxis lamellibrachiae]|uniref:Phosphate-specific transport system accessory protein PhoU n=1 Tax=Parasphingopyxis lamellibrachiae TaxID=680125 RepID=A0A3D9FBC3_9SPHN|nr:phosphate signaling complex protein PhoU [Parasphingopyxis lamellibrachiae]RED15120.1 PhoU-like phosphate uptake regulator [Parasphingopyxis lamellibrachiae]
MPRNSEHTVSAFDDDIGELRALVSEMGGLAETAIGDAIHALIRHDLETASRIIDEDSRIDELESEVERLAVRLIALRAPMANDLREAVAAIKIATVLERIGDYAKNIAKRVPIFDHRTDIEPLSILPSMAQIVQEMVHNVLDAFAARDAEAAKLVIERDSAVDDFYDSLFRALLTYMMENSHNITQSTHLLFIAKNLERVGDHATNIAEMVYFAATGDYLDDRLVGEAPALEAGEPEA